MSRAGTRRRAQYPRPGSGTGIELGAAERLDQDADAEEARDRPATQDGEGPGRQSAEVEGLRSDPVAPVRARDRVPAGPPARSGVLADAGMSRERPIRVELRLPPVRDSGEPSVSAVTRGSRHRRKDSSASGPAPRRRPAVLHRTSGISELKNMGGSSVLRGSTKGYEGAVALVGGVGSRAIPQPGPPGHSATSTPSELISRPLLWPWMPTTSLPWPVAVVGPPPRGSPSQSEL